MMSNNHHLKLLFHILYNRLIIPYITIFFHSYYNAYSFEKLFYIVTCLFKVFSLLYKILLILIKKRSLIIIHQRPFPIVIVFYLYTYTINKIIILYFNPHSSSLTWQPGQPQYKHRLSPECLHS